MGRASSTAPESTRAKAPQRSGPLALSRPDGSLYGQTKKSDPLKKDKEMSVVIERVIDPTSLRDRVGSTFASLPPATSAAAPRLAVIGLIGLRLAIGFEFLWAFFDKTFGLGYATGSAHAWINGGSPTKGFLSGASGPLQGVYNAIAGAPVVDWLFMLGLLGVGLALILGVAVRPAAAAGALMLALMWFAVWVPSTTAGGQPSGSTNPFVDDHIVGIVGLIAVAALVTWGTGYLGRKWRSLPIVAKHAWLH
jgi:thiosulfate dehydrogenase [quinone] large subunit